MIEASIANGCRVGPRRERPKAGRRFPRGFTLAELIVVIFIIVLLVAMVVPYLGGAKEQVYCTICQNNLNKISVALRTFGVNNSAQLPPATEWMGAAAGNASKEILKCPKGFFKGGAGGPSQASDTIKFIDPPPSAVFNTLEDNKKIFMFRERQGYALPSPVKVDIYKPGQYDNHYDRESTVIPAGTVVDCYFLHYDSVGSHRAQTSGFVTMAEKVLGLIVLTKSLDKTDKVLGYPGTVYSTGQRSRGFEQNQERVTFEPDERTLTIRNFYITFPGEEVRIITRSGGEASYGMNNQVNPRLPRPSQVLLSEYNKAVIDLDGKGWRDDDLNIYIAPRHFDRVNVLLVDGSVRLMWPDELEANSPLWRP
ncbi:MAG: prepilin-type N-terminal cleavage/methylation domain-containing protein [Planctomycetes bacterium]|nr:prepilin-type N-terminal cleavage/methylation domain-containing protein [Planctomycetota bacterium]